MNLKEMQVALTKHFSLYYGVYIECQPYDQYSRQFKFASAVIPSMPGALFKQEATELPPLDLADAFKVISAKPVIHDEVMQFCDDNPACEVIYSRVEEFGFYILGKKPDGTVIYAYGASDWSAEFDTLSSVGEPFQPAFKSVIQLLDLHVGYNSARLCDEFVDDSLIPEKIDIVQQTPGASDLVILDGDGTAIGMIVGTSPASKAFAGVLETLYNNNR